MDLDGCQSGCGPLAPPVPPIQFPPHSDWLPFRWLISVIQPAKAIIRSYTRPAKLPPCQCTALPPGSEAAASALMRLAHALARPLLRSPATMSVPPRPWQPLVAVMGTTGTGKSDVSRAAPLPAAPRSDAVRTEC